MRTAYAIHLKETPILALPHHPSYHTSLWWNNDNGWGHKSTADIFTADEKATLNLPLDGEWVEIYVEETETPQGVCEMETETWCCGNIDTLTETQVQPDPNSDHTEYRRVCSVCHEKYGEAERD